MVSIDLYRFSIEMMREMSVKECCNLLKISRSTWYNKVAEVG